MIDEDFDIRQERVSKAEKDFENALRPLSFSDFSGQQKVVENLEVFVEAAKYRGEPLDHTLLHGPPGLGKTTLSNIIANELGVGFKITSGPVLDKPGDLPMKEVLRLPQKRDAGSYPWPYPIPKTFLRLTFPSSDRHMLCFNMENP